LFRHNVETLGIDLRNLDFVVISHRHGDHTDGMRYLLSINPDVTIYVPNDEYFEDPTCPPPDRWAALGDHARLGSGAPRTGPRRRVARSQHRARPLHGRAWLRGSPSTVRPALSLSGPWDRHDAGMTAGQAMEPDRKVRACDTL
jgi:hypothetical protein